MVANELPLGVRIHALKRVESTGKVSFEIISSLDDFVHDLQSLLFSDTGSKREALKISTHSDTSGLDHSGVLLAEVSVNEALGVHVRDVGVFGTVTMVAHDDLVEELVESGVRAVGTSIDTDAGVAVLDARENAGLKADTGSIRLVLVLLPDIFGKVL